MIDSCGKKMIKKILPILLLLILLIPFTGCINDEIGTNKTSDDTDEIYPNANFTVLPPMAMIDEQVYLNSTSSHPNGTIVNWSWNMGDGSTFYESAFVYRYNKSGMYNITLTVTDEKNISDTVGKPIFIYKQSLLNNASLKIEDLPEGYVRYLESYNSSFGFNFSIPVIEIYNEQFIYKNPENNTGFPLIITTLCRFESSKDAENVLINSSQQMNKTFTDILTLISTDIPAPLGNQSIYRLFQGRLDEQYNYKNSTWSYIYFRIRNITVLVLLDEVPTSNINYKNLTYQYAEIIKDRIIFNLNHNYKWG